jgi:hypothetical protein
MPEALPPFMYYVAPPNHMMPLINEAEAAMPTRSIAVRETGYVMQIFLE